MDESLLFSIEQAIAVTESGQPFNLPATAQSGQSFLSVPLRVKHKIIGFIQLVRQGDTYPFDTDDERLTEALALPSSSRWKTHASTKKQSAGWRSIHSLHTGPAYDQ